MLQFIYGAAGSGKSNWVMNSIAEAVKTKEKIMLLVPEQFSFESERNLLSLLGEHGFSHVEVYSLLFIKGIWIGHMKMHWTISPRPLNRSKSTALLTDIQFF